MNTKDIVKKFHISLHHGHHDKYARVNPYRHWLWIVVGFTISSFIVLGFSVFMYYQIINGNFFSLNEEVSSGPAALDKAKLQSIVSFFEDKRERFDQEKAAPSNFVDPGV